MNTTSATNSLFDFHDETFTLVSSIVNSILAVPLNTYVVWLILKGDRRNLASEFFFLNLALSDIVFSGFSLCYLLFVILDNFNFFTAYMFFFGFLFTARPIFQCCICIECYFGVVHPVLFLRYKYLRYRVACCCVVWLYSLLGCIYNVQTYDKLLYLFGFFVQNIILFCVILYCCITAVLALKHPGPGEKVTERKKSNAAKTRAVKVILLILISFVICYSSFIISVPLQFRLKPIIFSNTLTIATCIALVSRFSLPLLFLHRSGRLPCFGKL